MIKKTIGLSLMSLALLSCGSKQYLINVNQPKESVRVSSITQKVGISNLTLPNYLLKYQIARQKENHQIEYLSAHQWADRLDSSLKRELIAYLQSYSSNQEILNYPWGALPNLSVDITINEFIALDREIVLDATVKVYHHQSRRTFIYPINEKENFSGEDADIAKAMSHTFTKLSHKIANILAKKR